MSTHSLNPLCVIEYQPVYLQRLNKLWDDCQLTRSWNNPSSDIARCLHNPSSTLLLGFSATELTEDQLMATVMVGNDGHRGWMYYLAVEPRARGQGFGAQMVKHAEAWLKYRGVVKINLMIRPENHQVKAFYQQLGYQQEDRLIMTTRLE